MDKIKELLLNRLERKENILREGGEQAMSHSEEDLFRIDRALNRLRTGSYGACIDCGCEIPKERLEAIPEAERCLSCQETHENRLN